METPPASPYRRDRPPGSSEAAWALRQMLLAAGDTRQALARRLGIGLTDASAIDHLVSAREPLGPVDLGNRLGITSASATALVDRLVRAGHVVRVPHPHDRRRVVLQVTGRAVEKVVGALRPMVDGIEQVVARLSPEQGAVTVRFLYDVMDVMHEYVATTPDESHG